MRGQHEDWLFVTTQLNTRVNFSTGIWQYLNCKLLYSAGVYVTCIIIFVAGLLPCTYEYRALCCVYIWTETHFITTAIKIYHFWCYNLTSPLFSIVRSFMNPLSDVLKVSLGTASANRKASAFTKQLRKSSKNNAPNWIRNRTLYSNVLKPCTLLSRSVCICRKLDG